MGRRVVGHCTPGCGACCRLIALPIASERAIRRTRRAVIASSPVVGDPGWRLFLDARGIRVRGRWVVIPCPEAPGAVRAGRYAGAAVLYVEHVCRQLDEAGRCRLYGLRERPFVCDVWPTPDDDLTAVADRCTYRVES